MHDFTVTQLNDHRLTQFDSEVESSRLMREARAHRLLQRAEPRRTVPALSLARWTWHVVQLAVARARGV